MSTVSGNVFPNTTFPDSIQTLPIFEDLDVSYESVYSKYINALVEGNFLEANNYLERVNPNSLVTAQALNTMSDTIAAIQTLYSNTDVFTDIVDKKQAEWMEILKKFGYLGDWIQPTVFSSNVNYATNSVVLYNNVMWIRTAEQSTAKPVPQINSVYWAQYYRKNSMVTFIDEESDRRILYIASTDISVIDNPFNNSQETNPQWLKIALQGIRGDNGDGFSFKNEWANNATYSLGDLVVYNKACYSSLRASNTNHNPGTSTTWWKKEFQTGVAQIPIQAEEPMGQEDGDLWFQLV